MVAVDQRKKQSVNSELSHGHGHGRSSPWKSSENIVGNSL